MTTPTPNAGVNSVITTATNDITKYAPAVLSGLQNAIAAVQTPGQSHLQAGLSAVNGVLTAAANVPNATVDEIAGFGEIITTLVSTVVGLFHKSAASATPTPATASATAPASTQTASDPLSSEVTQLQAQNAQLAAENSALQAQIAQIEAQLTGTSSTTAATPAVAHASAPTATAAKPAEVNVPFAKESDGEKLASILTFGAHHEKEPAPAAPATPTKN
jgi:hypothetical protein